VSVKTERYNLIVNDPLGTAQLFDLLEDAHENSNLAPSRPDLVAQLRAALDAGPAAPRETGPAHLGLWRPAGVRMCGGRRGLQSAGALG
jgi:hypothetical protein